MLSFVKNFKTLVPEVVQLVLVIVIAVYTLAFKVAYAGGFFNIITILLPLILITGSAVWLVLYKKNLAGHAILLLGLYINGLTIFINALFRLQFSPFSYNPGFTPQMFVDLVIFAYLALIVTSYVLEGGITTKPLKGKTFVAGVLLFLFVWIFQNFYTAISLLALPLIALWIGLEFPALLLMLSVVIDEPFRFINDAINKTLGWRNLTYYLYIIGAIFFIYLFSVSIYKQIKEKSYQE